MMITGIEKHPTLQTLLFEIEDNIHRKKTNYIKLNLRKCAEYIVGQYIREYPDFAVGNLYERISKLETVISESEAHLLHAMRKAGNEGGAHLEEIEKAYNEHDDFQEAVKLNNELLEYLPNFLNKFPEQNKTPVPKAEEIKYNFELNIDYNSLEPLELHEDWWKCIDYNALCSILEGLTRPFYTAYNMETMDDLMVKYPEIYHWIWLPRLNQKMKIVFSFPFKGEEYLSIPLLVKYYEQVVKDFIEDRMNFWSHYDEVFRENFCHRQYNPDTEEVEGIHIPGIIQKYFPGSCIYYEPGKGFKWKERNEERINEEFNALIKGCKSSCYTSLTELTENGTLMICTWEYKRISLSEQMKKHERRGRKGIPVIKPVKPPVAAPVMPKLSEEERKKRQEDANRRMREAEEAKKREAKMLEQAKSLFDDLANGIL